MNPLPPDPDSINVDSDGPGDNTHRPCSPERRAFLEKEQELRRRWGEPPEDVNVDSDGPGDNTHRPCSPERRAFLEKERERLRRLREMQDRGDAPDAPANGQ